MSGGKLLSNMHRSGPNCSMQCLIQGVIDSANSSEPIGTSRACQPKPKRGMPSPPSFMVTLWQAATAVIPSFQTGIISSSLPAYIPTRLTPPTWFTMMGKSGTALANSAISGNCGKDCMMSRLSPIWLKTLAPSINLASLTIPSFSRLSQVGSVFQVMLWRMPRNRLGLAAWRASSTGVTPAPSFRSA